jgi:ribonuclease HII
LLPRVFFSVNRNLPLFRESVAPEESDTLFHEAMARKAGYRLIAGVDEAGRGPLAGPVVASAVILPEGVRLAGVRDSKEMTEGARERAFSVISERALAVGIAVVSHKVIDEINILRAALEAMRQAVLSLDPAPEFFLVDGIHEVPVAIPQKCLKKGDRISQSISAASVMAKVYRDRIMCAYHDMFPVYGFLDHKGYGTARHLAAIRAHGASPFHRVSFKGVR